MSLSASGRTIQRRTNRSSAPNSMLGLLSYPVLVPLQIAILMLMYGLAVRTRTLLQSTIVGHRTLVICRAVAVLYLASMAVRLAFAVHTYGDEYYLHGAIPVAFH
jgi:hypothetical protein